MVEDNTLPVVPSSSIDLLLEYEEEALEHYVFNSGSASLVGLVNQNSLTEQGQSPSYSASFMTLQMTEGDALMTPFADQDEFTYCAIIQAPTVADQLPIFIGNLEEASVSTGSSLYLGTGGDLQHNVRGLAASDYGLQNSSLLTAGNWVFVAGSYRSDGANSNSAINAFIGGNSSFQSVENTNLTTSKSLDDDNFSLGNSNYQGSNVASPPPLNIMEAIFFDGFKDVDELQKIWLRSKERAAVQGITLGGG